MNEYRLDRTAFKAHTAKEAADHERYYEGLTMQERGDLLNYLNSMAYNYPENNPPRMDRTIFSIRKEQMTGFMFKNLGLTLCLFREYS